MWIHFNLCEMGNHVEENINDINKWYINIWDMIYKRHIISIRNKKPK